MFDHGGTPKPVLANLMLRTKSHSPELVAAMSVYHKTRGEVALRTTYNGSDCSVELMFFLFEALERFEQLRLEVLEQSVIHKQYEEAIPGRLYLTMSQMLSFEPILLQATKNAVMIHSSLWDRRETLSKKS